VKEDKNRRHFMKRLFAGILVLVMVLSFTACGGGSVPDFASWHTEQLGHMTVRVPASVSEEEHEAEGIKMFGIESRTRSVRVVGAQFEGMASLLRDMGIPEEIIVSNSLYGSVQGFLRDYLRQSGGEMHGEIAGELNGIVYHGAYGESDRAAFVVRGFVYGDDFYIVMISLREDVDGLIEEFFQSIRFE